MEPFGPRKVTVSWHANCPGCIKSFTFVGLFPGPKSFAKVSAVQWKCRFEMLTVTWPMEGVPIPILFRRLTARRLYGLKLHEPDEILGLQARAAHQTAVDVR